MPIIMITELLESARLDTGRASLNLAPVLDERHARTVLRNVLENAVKYSAHQAHPVELWAEAAESRVLITVRDWGYGIPQSDLGSIFEPFYGSRSPAPRVSRGVWAGAEPEQENHGRPRRGHRNRQR